jgi:hypothetical protein
MMVKAPLPSRWRPEFQPEFFATPSRTEWFLETATMSPRRDFITSFRHRVAKVAIFAHFRPHATFGGKILTLLAFFSLSRRFIRTAQPSGGTARCSIRTTRRSGGVVR